MATPRAKVMRGPCAGYRKRATRPPEQTRFAVDKGSAPVVTSVAAVNRTSFESNGSIHARHLDASVVSYEADAGLTEHKLVVGQLQQRVDELQTVYQLSDAINRAEAIEDVYEVALNELQRTLNVDRVGVLLFDRDGTLRFRASRGLSENYREAVEIYLSQARDVTDTKLILMSDVRETSRFEPLLAAILGAGIRAIAYAPLIHRGMLLGRLNVCYSSAREFSAEEVQFLRTVATQISFAIGRKQAEQELRASEKRHRSLFEKNLSGICRTALSGRILDCNDSFARIFGYESREEVVLAGALALYPRSEDREAFVVKLREQHTLNNIELHLKRKDGSPVWILGNASLVDGDEGQSAVVEGIWMDITERKLAEDELKNSRERLRALSAHLQVIREEERTNISREIHDELGQALTRLKIDLALLSDELPEDGRHLLHKTSSMSKLVDSTLDTVREISSRLRPSVLDHLGLTAAIEQELSEFQGRTGIGCHFMARPEDLKLDREHSTAVFRILQEALTNVARHAHATRVDARLTRKNGYVKLAISDNGRGIPEDRVYNPHSLGLIGMRERALQWGGKLEIGRQKGIGTLIKLVIPLRRSAA